MANFIIVILFTVINIIWITKSIHKFGEKKFASLIIYLGQSIFITSVWDVLVILLSLFSMFATTTGRISQEYSIAVITVNSFMFFQSYWNLMFASPKAERMDFYIHTLEQVVSMFIFVGILIAAFANIYSMHQLIYNNTKVNPDILTVLYFSVVTWTTLGYGDFSPSEEVRKFAAAEAIAGYIAFTILLSGLISAISKLNSGMSEEAGKVPAASHDTSGKNVG